MKERRKFLKSLGTATVGITAAGVAGASAAAATGAASAVLPARPVRLDGNSRDTFPDVEVTNHNGDKFRFYDDLIKDKVVMINFMSLRTEQQFPIMAKMAAIAEQLKDRLGKDVHIVSVSRDPEYDTPRRLSAFAEKLGVRDGWHLVTGNLATSSALETRLYRHKHTAVAGLDCSTGVRKLDIVFYGNGSAGVWGTFPIDIQADDAATRITWVMPGSKPEGAPRRAGPRRDAVTAGLSHNRDA